MTYHTSQFCLWCIEWTIRSVNSNAYIMIAITGKSFCRASAIATGLIISKILRIGKVNVIGDVILYLGKLCVNLSSAVFAVLMLDTHKYRSAYKKISFSLLPVLVCWALVMLSQLSSLLLWRCQLILSFFHSVRIQRSTRGQHNMLLLF